MPPSYTIQFMKGLLSSFVIVQISSEFFMAIFFVSPLQKREDRARKRAVFSFLYPFPPGSRPHRQNPRLQVKAGAQAYGQPIWAGQFPVNVWDAAPWKVSEPVLFAPDTQLVENLHQRPAAPAEGIFHPRWDLGIFPAHNKLIRFQLLQVAAQRFIRDGFQIPFEFIEPYHFKFHQAIQNHHFMLAGDERQGVAEAGVFKIRIFNIILDHRILSPKIVHIFYTSTCFFNVTGYNYR